MCSSDLNWHNVKHEMGFFSAEKTGKMPMKTDAEDISTQLKWRLALDNNSQLLLAQEYGKALIQLSKKRYWLASRHQITPVQPMSG